MPWFSFRPWFEETVNSEINQILAKTYLQPNLKASTKTSNANGCGSWPSFIRRQETKSCFTKLPMFYCHSLIWKIYFKKKKKNEFRIYPSLIRTSWGLNRIVTILHNLNSLDQWWSKDGWKKNLFNGYTIKTLKIYICTALV